MRNTRFIDAAGPGRFRTAFLLSAACRALVILESVATPKVVAEARNPRNSGLSRKRARHPLSKFAGLGEARPALKETRYLGPIVGGDGRAEVTPGPGDGETRVWATRGREPWSSVEALLLQSQIGAASLT